MSTVFYGALVTPVSLTAYDALPRALLAVSRHTGDITWLECDVHPHEIQDALERHGMLWPVDFIELKHGEFLLPGFIDTHIHAPQVPNIGSGQQHELLDWLEEVTFPMEARFADADFARRAYTSVVKRTLDYGSTTCCYYGTLHLEGTKVLADVIHSYGQRAFVGKCNMDRNAPDYYVEPSPAASADATRSLIAHIRALPAGLAGEPLVHPILTPRFAISCSGALLAELGAIAKADPELAIQTHISENAAEIAFTKTLFPPSDLPLPPSSAAADEADGAEGMDETDTVGAAARGTYAGVYDAYGLLRGNTVLAHAVHLEDAEAALIAARGAGVSHCPTSNFNLRSGCARVGALLDRGIKVGLGTDVSGGFSPSVLTAVQHASMCSKVIAMNASASPSPSSSTTSTTSSASASAPASPRFADKQLPVATLLHLATRGGASVCALDSRIGALAPGMAFDALVASVRADAGNPALWGADLDAALGVKDPAGHDDDEGGRARVRELEGMLERFLFTGDDRNVRRVYVQGRLVGGKEGPGA